MKMRDLAGAALFSGLFLIAACGGGERPEEDTQSLFADVPVGGVCKRQYSCDNYPMASATSPIMDGCGEGYQCPSMPDTGMCNPPGGEKTWLASAPCEEVNPPPAPNPLPKMMMAPVKAD